MTVDVSTSRRLTQAQPKGAAPQVPVSPSWSRQLGAPRDHTALPAKLPSMAVMLRGCPRCKNSFLETRWEVSNGRIRANELRCLLGALL